MLFVRAGLRAASLLAWGCRRLPMLISSRLWWRSLAKNVAATHWIRASGLVAQVANYLVKVAGFRDVDKWKDSDLLETAAELWMNEREGAALSTIFRRQILAWVGGPIGPPAFAPPPAPARSDVDA